MTTRVALNKVVAKMCVTHRRATAKSQRRTGKVRLHWFIPLFGLIILMMSLVGILPAVAQDNLPPFNLVGSAVLLEDRLRLTPDESDQAGGAWLLSKQIVEGGFEATFQFQISTDGADGLAFVIQNTSGSALGGVGGGMGYEGIANSLAIEFDTWQNIPEDFPSQQGDPNDKHISIQTRGTLPNSPDPTLMI